MALLNRKFSNLFGNCRDAVVVVRDGLTEYCNRAAAELIPGIGELNPAAFLPAQALGGELDYRGETDIAGCRTAFSSSTIEGCRVTILSRPVADGNDDTADVLFAASVELKNMLSVLKMASGLLLPYIENLGNPRLNRYTAMIYHCFYNMLRLTNNLGDLGSILRGDTVLTRTSFDIVACCRELIGSAAHLVKDRGHQIRFESCEESIDIYADKPRLERMLLNILANSCQNMVRDGAVTVSVVTAGGRVVISVSDNGDGIGEDILPTAWNRYSVPKDLAEQSCGIGLGLTIVQNIVRLHGGSAVLESRPGEGTTVTISLPMESPEITDFKTNVADYGGYSMQLLLTELSGVISYDKYTQLYMD